MKFCGKTYNSGITLKGIKKGLFELKVDKLSVPAKVSDRASVALVLSGNEKDLKLCLIQRAIRSTDPWSGQMALPGGRATLDDPDSFSVAIREVREEVGIDLSSAIFLGRLSDIQLMRGGKVTLGVVTPFLFYMGIREEPFLIDKTEVEHAFWIAVSYLQNPANQRNLRDSSLSRAREISAIYFEQKLIWGMTYRLISDLFSLCQPVG